MKSDRRPQIFTNKLCQTNLSFVSLREPSIISGNKNPNVDESTVNHHSRATSGKRREESRTQNDYPLIIPPPASLASARQSAQPGDDSAQWLADFSRSIRHLVADFDEGVANRLRRAATEPQTGEVNQRLWRELHGEATA